MLTTRDGSGTNQKDGRKIKGLGQRPHLKCHIFGSALLYYEADSTRTYNVTIGRVCVRSCSRARAGVRY